MERLTWAYIRLLRRCSHLHITIGDGFTVEYWTVRLAALVVQPGRRSQYTSIWEKLSWRSHSPNSIPNAYGEHALLCRFRSRACTFLLTLVAYAPRMEIQLRTVRDPFTSSMTWAIRLSRRPWLPARISGPRPPNFVLVIAARLCSFRNTQRSHI